MDYLSLDTNFAFYLWWQTNYKIKTNPFLVLINLYWKYLNKKWDGNFFVSVAFIFNWIGFLLLMCFCHTIASRYGALSGFGLSLAKWTFIVQHSTELASKDNSWLWWLIMTFGEYIIAVTLKNITSSLFQKGLFGHVKWSKVPSTLQ